MNKIALFGAIAILSTCLMSVAFATDKYNNNPKEKTTIVRAIKEDNGIGITVDDFMKKYNLTVQLSNKEDIIPLSKKDFKFITIDSKTTSELRYYHMGSQFNKYDFQLLLVPKTDRIKEIRVLLNSPYLSIINSAIVKVIPGSFNQINGTWERNERSDMVIFKNRGNGD